MKRFQQSQNELDSNDANDSSTVVARSSETTDNDEFEARLMDLDPKLIKILRNTRANDRNLKVLKFIDKYIVLNVAKALSLAILTNSTVDNLNLMSKHIEAGGVQHIATALLTNKTLAMLNLRDSNIGDEDVKYIATALLTNNTLAHLNLCQNNIGFVGAQDIATTLLTNNGLANLELGSNNIEAAGAKHIANALLTNNTLVRLELESNNIGAEGTKYIATALLTNNKLVRLNLGSNNIKDEGAKYIATALSTNNTLARLALGNNNIGDAGAKYIASALLTNNALAHLDLWINNIGDAGIKDIATALLTNTTLAYIDIGRNSISNEGARAIQEALNTNTTVTDIIFGDHDNIQETVLNSINAALERNRNFKNKIVEITTPLYALDEKGFPAWQTNPYKNAVELDHKINEIIASNPIFKNSKLLQELHGLKCLCLAHHCYNVYLYDTKNKKEEILELIIENLSRAEAMGYHIPVTHLMAMDDIKETTNPHHRMYLDDKLPGKDNSDREARRATETSANRYAYNRFKLRKALNGPTPTEAELYNAVKPLRNVTFKNRY